MKREYKKLRPDPPKTKPTVHGSGFLLKRRTTLALRVLGVAAVVVALGPAVVLALGIGRTATMLAAATGASLVFGLAAAATFVLFLGRVPFRVVETTQEGTHLEVDDGRRSLRLRFPLDYRTGYHVERPTVPFSHGAELRQVVLRLAVFDANGHVAFALEERLRVERREPPGFVAIELDLPTERTYFPFLGKPSLEQVAHLFERANLTTAGYTPG